jgi:serine/threonine protein kinase
MVICSHCQTVNNPANVACSSCGAPLGLDDALGGDPFLGRALGGGRFTPQVIVGSGEIGMVYRGIDSKTGQVVAIKIVHPDVAAAHGDELLKAAGSVARLRHAKIATLLAAAREPDGTTFFVTEFVEGETLKDLLGNTGPLTPRRAADILFQLCSALAPFHKAGRPHANLKPENVFLTAREEGDSVKLVDAGSPELFGVRETVGGHMVVGNPKYFSPEQALGEPVGLDSDIFTLGVIGYQLLSGALPFFGATPDQLLDSIVNGTPTPVEHRASGALPPRLAASIRRCLAKRPADRFPDLRALATELAAVIKGSPAPAPAAPKRRFGTGAGQPSTVIADVNTLAGLIDSDEDEDRTVARNFTDDALDVLDIGPSVTPKGPEKLEEIPEPLMFTGALDGDALRAALDNARKPAAVAAAPKPPAQPPVPAAKAPPAQPPAQPPAPAAKARAPVDPLEAAMLAAMAEVGDGQAPPRSVPPSDLPVGVGEVKAGFDPFGGGSAATGEPKAADKPARPKTPVQPAPRLADAILDAMDDVAPSQGKAASPLATAADFAAIAPQNVTTSDALTALPPPPEERNTGRMVLLAVLLVVLAGGTWVYFQFLQPSDPTPPRRPVAARTEAAPTQAAPSEAGPESAPSAGGETVASAPGSDAPASEPAPLAVALLSDPPGAQVLEGDQVVGKTPYDLTFAQAAPARAFVLKLDGYLDAEQRVDPTGMARGEAPVEVKVKLKKRPVVRKDGDGRKPPQVKNPYDVENPY